MERDGVRLAGLRVMPHGDEPLVLVLWANAEELRNSERRNMKTSKFVLWTATSALALSVLTTGCDRTLSRTESEKVKSDGTVEKKEKSVTESPDGTVTKTEEKKTERP
jgi:hypothetical protein